MKAFKNTFYLCLSIYVVGTLLLLGGYSEDLKGVSVYVGLTAVLLSVVYLLLGIIGCFFKSLSEAAKGMLAAAGVLALIGFYICSTVSSPHI